MPHAHVCCAVLQNDSLATLLARLEGILAPLPEAMIRKGRFSHRFYTRQGHIYERSQRTVCDAAHDVHRMFRSRTLCLVVHTEL